MLKLFQNLILNISYKVILFNIIIIMYILRLDKIDSYAIEKPTYSDMIKDRYDNKISDKEAKSIALEESTMKETYTKGIKTLASMEETKTTLF